MNTSWGSKPLVKPAQQPQMLENFRSGRLSVELPSYARVKRYAFLGNGVNNYIDCGNGVGLGIATQLTLEIWMKFSVSQISRVFAGRYEAGVRAYAIGISDAVNNIIKFFTVGTGGSNTLYSILTYNDGKYHHVVGTWDGATKRLYIDLILVNSVAYGGTMTGWAISSKFSIGALYFPAGPFFGQYFNGGIALSRLYSRALTALERSHNRRYPFDAIRNGLVSECLLEEGSGATAYDTSGFGNNGTFNGANYWNILGDDVLTFERV